MKKTWEIFWRCLALGCVIVGAMVAHISHFLKTYIEKLQ